MPDVAYSRIFRIYEYNENFKSFGDQLVGQIEEEPEVTEEIEKISKLVTFLFECK